LLQKLNSKCTPNIFYTSIRPYLAGWKNSSLLPKGVIYEGTSQRLASPSHPINWETGYRTYIGGSNGQSPVIQALDIVLGIEHRPTRNAPSECGGFITDMREYMPGPHRRFLEDLNRVSDIRDYVLRCPIGEAGCELRDVYNACVVGMRRFRDTHMQIASRYILIPARATVKKQCPRTATGTGGTELISFLKQVRQETIAAATFKPLPKMTPALHAQPDWKMALLMGKSRGSFC
jgi:indoleamine 2,3-dioxygenase